MKSIQNITLAIVAVLFIGGCASTGVKRVFMDSTTHSDDLPDWAKSTKTSWEKDNKIYMKATHQVRGNERVAGCYDLARLNAKEAMLSAIANDVRGRIDNAQQSISENAEIVLSKVRTGEFDGRLIGFKINEEYYERYKVEENEKIDCYVLGEIKQSDYDQVKRAVVDRVVAVDPKLKEAIKNKQVDFFNKEATN